MTVTSEPRPAKETEGCVVVPAPPPPPAPPVVVADAAAVPPAADCACAAAAAAVALAWRILRVGNCVDVPAVEVVVDVVAAAAPVCGT